MTYVSERSFRINETVVAADLDNEMVLLNIETGLYFGLDELGSMIWSLLAEGMAETAIVQRILDEYDAEPERVRRDVEAFLVQLQGKGLLLPSDAGEQ